MTVRRQLSALLALGALLLGAGCSGGDSLVLSAETDDPLYLQSQQLKRQGRNSEALTSLLKVIDKRGELASPESHLDAGLIYLEHIKDPIEAIHHFRKYLELAPNSTKAPLVRQRVDLARRELFRSMPGRPSEEPFTRGGSVDVVERQQREIDELKAELGRQRGSGPAPFLRTTRGSVEAAEAAPAPAGGGQSPLKIAPLPPSFVPEPVVAPPAPSPSLGARPAAALA
jgi:tetratricopeptide (TPR) repeat protein